MKNISILGSTGSIGVNALNVIDNLADKFNVKALSAYKNSNVLIEQAKKYQPETIAIVDSSEVDFVKNSLKNSGSELCKKVVLRPGKIPVSFKGS